MKRPQRRPANVVIAEDSSDVITSILSPPLKKAGYNVYSVVPERNWLPTFLRLKPRAVLFNAGRQKRTKARLATEVRKKLKDAVLIGILGENESGGSPSHKHFDHCFAIPVDEGILLAAISPRESHRVLLIEDHAPLAEVTAEFMRLAGLDVRIASTGEEALKMATASLPEIILCDVRLPDIPGPDVVRALRRLPGAKHTVIAMHSAGPEFEIRLLESGGDSSVNMFLSKPLTEEKLEVLIKELEVLRSTPSPYLK
jgi:DNA-binding response OmpR family regulator